MFLDAFEYTEKYTIFVSTIESYCTECTLFSTDLGFSVIVIVLATARVV
jgi:hypothetical protein